MKHSTARRGTAWLASAALLAAAPLAGAEQFWVDAPVLDVQPLVRVVQVTVPQQVCWNEPVTTAGGPAGPRSHTPALLGGIVGGVVGNQFGGGRGRTALTIAGALLGASVGNDVANRRRAYTPPVTTLEQRCQVEQVSHEEERVDGYRVTYSYGGREFVTHSPVEPGERIRVRVQVEPVSYNEPYPPAPGTWPGPASGPRYYD